MPSAGKQHQQDVRETVDLSVQIFLIRTKIWRKLSNLGNLNKGYYFFLFLVICILRFTPPTHTILAFRQSLKEFYEEGGLTGREKKYKENRAVLKNGMAEMGFKELVPEQYAGHIITCFYYPKHFNFSFEKFYQKLSDIGMILLSIL